MSLMSEEENENSPQNKAAKEYIKISTTVIKKMQKALPFDVYIQRAPGKYTKIIVAGNSVDKEQLEKYQTEKNVMFLYVHEKQIDTYHYQVESLLESALSNDGNSTKAEVRSILNEMTHIALDEMYEKTDISTKTLRWAQISVEGCTKILEQDFTGLLKIIKVFAARPHHMKHAFMTSMFSLLIGKGMEYESERTLRNLGLGGLLHDIGLTRLSPEISTKTDLTPEEWKEMKQHPELGVVILDSLPGIPSEVRQIVLQHHEQPNGMGFPNSLHDREIFQLAKVVAVADSFCDLITKKADSEVEYSPIEAIKRIEDDIGKYDKQVVKAFKKVVLPAQGTTKKTPRFHN